MSTNQDDRQFSFSPADCYWKYLESAGITLELDLLSPIATIIENTSWDNPTSALDFNNVAVVALVEGEQCQEPFMRRMYFEMALEALNKGVELYDHPICAAHLALCFTISEEIEQALNTAFLTLLNTLNNSYINEQQIHPGLVYLPTRNSCTNSRDEQLAQILQAEKGYTQSLLLLSEVFCDSILAFYSVTGLRYLHLAAQLFTKSSSINLKLGISSIGNSQGEGILYLHRALELAPNSANIRQALYLAYRDFGQIKFANYWLNISRHVSRNNFHYLDYKWTDLEADSPVTYLSFENQVILAVEPSFRSAVTRVLIAEGDWFEREYQLFRYQPYLQELIPISYMEDLQGRLNIIACPTKLFKN